MAARKNPSKGVKPDKLMRDALSIELHREQEVEIGGKKVKVKRLRLVASALVNKAIEGDTPAIKEINDRMDGKVPQAIVGDDTQDPIRIGDVSDDQRARALAVFLAKSGNGPTEPKAAMAQQSQKRTKPEVHYTPHAERHSERCALCEYFIASHGKCRRVKGDILQSGWCKLFSRK